MIAELARTALVATLTAGAVAVARQRRESVQVRRGELTPHAQVVDDPPRRPYGPVGAWFAAWQPAPPRHRLTRVLTVLWAAPLSAVGLVVAGLSGRRPRYEPAHGCLVARGVGGMSRRMLGAVGAHANAVGHVVLSRVPDPSAALLAHEALHVRQAERLGPLLLPTYAWLGAWYGYRDHPLERAARRAARDVAAAPPP